MAKLTQKTVTQVQIAKEAGVSQAAVSSIFSGSSTVAISEETRQHVLDIAKRLGFTFRKGKPHSKRHAAKPKGVVFFVGTKAPEKATNEPWVDAGYDTYMSTILSTIGHHLQGIGVRLSIVHYTDSGDLMRSLTDSDVAGVIWSGPNIDQKPIYQWMAARFPVVLLNRESDSTILIDSVGVDQEKNVLIAIDHLIEMGHSRIAYFGHCPSKIIHRQRLTAYQRSMGEHNLRNYSEFQQIDDSIEVAAQSKLGEIITTWKELGEDAPTALITADAFALPLLREARHAGISIPDDLSIIGIDNTPACGLVDPALSSMEQPLEEISRIAVDLFLRRYENTSAPSTTIQISPSLVSRASVKQLIDPILKNTSPVEPSVKKGNRKTGGNKTSL